MIRRERARIRRRHRAADADVGHMLFEGRTTSSTRPDHGCARGRDHDRRAGFNLLGEGLRDALDPQVLARSFPSGCSHELPAPQETGCSPAPKRADRGPATFGDIRAVDPANVADGLRPRSSNRCSPGSSTTTRGQARPGSAERWEVSTTGRPPLLPPRGRQVPRRRRGHGGDVKRSVEILHGSAPNPMPLISMLRRFDELNGKKAGDDGRRGRGGQVRRRLPAEGARLDVPAARGPHPAPRLQERGNRYSDTWHPCGVGRSSLPPSGWQRGRTLTPRRHDAYFRPGLPTDGVRWVFHENQNTQTYRFLRGELDVLRDRYAGAICQADPRWKAFAEYDADHQIIGEAMNTRCLRSTTSRSAARSRPPSTGSRWKR